MIEIVLNGRKFRRSAIQEIDNGVSVEYDPASGSPIKYRFEGSSWTESKARKYISNRKLNEATWDNHGKDTFINKIRLSPQKIKIELVGDEEKETAIGILGDEIYQRLSEIEKEYGNDSPPIFKMTAMEFNGEDHIVADSSSGRIRFSRKGTLENLDSFANVPMSLGHMRWDDTHQHTVGNTVASFIDENGNPSVYAYIYPHGEAGEKRKSLEIASAQGIIGMHELSATGDPVDFDIVANDEDHELYGKVDLDVRTWKADGLDFVKQGAATGSKVEGILNSLSKNSRQKNKDVDGGKKLDDLTLSEVLEALKEKGKRIVLSDLMSVPRIEEVIKEHVKAEVKAELSGIVNDKEKAEDLIKDIPDAIFLSSERVAGIVQEKFDKKMEKFDSNLADVEKIARANNLELSEAQMTVVKNNITDNMKEEDIISLCKNVSALKLSSELKGSIIDESKKKNDENESGDKFGVSVKLATERKSVIQL